MESESNEYNGHIDRQFELPKVRPFDVFLIDELGIAPLWLQATHECPGTGECWLPSVEALTTAGLLPMVMN